MVCLCGMVEIEVLVEKEVWMLDIVVFLDVDYSDYFDLLLDLIVFIEKGEWDFVFGFCLLGKWECGVMLF